LQRGLFTEEGLVTEALFLLMRFVAEGACHIGTYQRGALSNVVRGMNFDSL
jgi:hypothetical protein